MIKGIYTASSSMISRPITLQVIANNLANVNTPGFKKDSIKFRSLLDANVSLRQAGAIESGGVEDSIEYRVDFRLGPIQQTHGRLDVAIDGDGFFSLETPAGTRYTRNGSFRLDAEGNLTTHTHFQVLGEGGAIQIDENDVNIRINSRGDIMVDRDVGGVVGGQIIGKLLITDFDKPYQLAKDTNGLFVPSDPSYSGNVVIDPSVKQGFLENSNVNPFEAMVEMIENMQNNQSSQKVMSYQDDTLRKAVTEVGSF